MVSTLASVVPAQPFIWRNYSYPCDHHSRYPGTCNASLITALRATSAAPSYFDDIVHEHGRHLDGGCIANNPTAIAIHEARCLFPGREVNCVVSLATGAPPISANANAGVGWQGVFSTVIHSASSVNRVADCLCDTLVCKSRSAALWEAGRGLPVVWMAPDSIVRREAIAGRGELFSLLAGGGAVRS